MTHMHAEVTIRRPIAAELTWVGDGAWVACDPSLAEHDPHRVIAFLECRDHHVDVIWVRDQRPPERFEGLREALRAVRSED